MDCSLLCSSVTGFPRREYWSGLPFPFSRGPSQPELVSHLYILSIGLLLVFSLGTCWLPMVSDEAFPSQARQTCFRPPLRSLAPVLGSRSGFQFVVYFQGLWQLLRGGLGKYFGNGWTTRLVGFPSGLE